MSEGIPESIRSFVSSKVFHKTWAGTFYCKPQAIFQPRTIEEVQELVNQARICGKTIMTVGSGHSPSDLTMTNEWLCNLDKLNRVIEKKEIYGRKVDATSDDDAEVKFVDLTVEAGCRLYELNEYVKTHDLAIQNLGSISEQSLAGIISTGTHGSSQYHGLVCQQYVSIDLVNSTGQLVTCSLIENEELFRAALLSLGKVGIIVRVTIRTIPRYNIKSKQEIISFDTLLKNWDNIWLDSEFIRIWWFPYTSKCVCWRASKTDEPLLEPKPSWYGSFTGRLFYEAMLWLSVHVLPRLTPFIERFVFKHQYGDVETLGKGEYAVQNSVEALNMDCLFSQLVNEWASPLKNGVDVLTKLNNVIQDASKNNDFYVHAPIEVRCSNVTYSDTPYIDEETEKPSLYPPRSWLAKRNRLSPGPIHGNNLRPYLDAVVPLPYVDDCSKVTNDQLTLYINATMYRPFSTHVDTKKWYGIFERIMSDANGRPHWAKNFIGLDGEHVTSSDSDLQKRYGGHPSYTMKGFQPLMGKWLGNRLHDFNIVRKLTDPDGIFLSGKSWSDRNGFSN